MMNTMAARLGGVVLFGLILGLCVGLACSGTAKTIGKAAVADVVACTTPDVTKWSAQLGPALEQSLLRAVGMDGKIDVPSLQQIGDRLEADGWCVLERAVAQLIAAAAAPRNPSAPASAETTLDAQDLAGQLARLRVQKFGATQFQLGPAL